MSRYVRVPLGDTPPKKKPEKAPGGKTSAGAEISAGAAAQPATSAPKGGAPAANRQPQPVTVGPPAAARTRTPWLLIGGLLVGAGVLVYVLASPRGDRR